MNNTTFTVYWMYRNLVPNSLQFTVLTKALAYMETLRSDIDDGVPYSAITMCAEMTDMVGKMGVDSVVNGKTPDGEVYEWSKAGRAGKTKRSERNILIDKKDEA